MRRLIVILMGLLLAVPLTAQNKAILIGVSDYPKESGWCKLSSHNDVKLLNGLLSPTWDVLVVEDTQATHDGIVSAFSRIVKKVTPGDTVLIHFSGHGQQMIPLEKDTIHDPDLLDESIVPYDANKDWHRDYIGQNHIRDNELGALIDNVRDKAGISGLVVVILDACHSDSMQRDSESESDTTLILRGTTDIFGDPKSITPEIEKNRFKRDTTKIVVSNNANVVYISACQSNSRNAEIITSDGVGYGSLSFAVAGALADVGLRDLHAFLDSVMLKMNTLVSYQNPGVRASFVYTRPEVSHPGPPSIKGNGEPYSHSNIGLILLAVAALIVIVIVIWRMKKT